MVGMCLPTKSIVTEKWLMNGIRETIKNNTKLKLEK